MDTNYNPDAAPLRDVAQNPDAYTQYLAETQRVLLAIGQQLQVLADETRVHCRGTHVEGDRWYHARLRARPVEKALHDVLKHVEAITAGLEKSAYSRRAYDDQVKALPAVRHEKALAKARKKNPELTVVQNSTQQVPAAPQMSYGVPTSLYDINRESA